MLKNINPKVKRGLSITAHVIGTISFIFIVYAVATAWIDPAQPVVTPYQAVRQIDNDPDPDNIPKNEIVKARITEIRRVPLYGYSYRVSDRMYIMNFSRLNLKVGSTVRFKIKGFINVGNTYLVNADYE